MANIKLGIDRIEQFLYLFEGKKIGLITNPTGVNSQLRSTIDILSEVTNLVVLFSPEHGVRGDKQAGAKVEPYLDPKTGVKVYSLYGKNKKPTQEMIENIDVFVLDIQDIGSRLYTYIYTMAYAMQSAKEWNKSFIVFDRPNPMGGNIVEGNLVKAGFTSFIGLYPIPYRHGLTIGELATLFNNEFGIDCDLTVIPMTGWKRDMDYEQTDLEWILPSPNMPTIETVFAYHATCFFEGTNISEGRGTTKPFELVGATWLDAEQLANTMNEKELSGVYFRPAYFTPTFSKHQDQLCKGVQIHILDRKKFQALHTGLHLLKEIRAQNQEKFAYSLPYTEKGRSMIDYNTGSDYIRTHDFDPDKVYKQWREESVCFEWRKRQYHLYN